MGQTVSRTLSDLMESEISNLKHSIEDFISKEIDAQLKKIEQQVKLKFTKELMDRLVITSDYVLEKTSALPELKIRVEFTR